MGFFRFVNYFGRQKGPSADIVGGDDFGFIFEFSLGYKFSSNPELRFEYRKAASKHVLLYQYAVSDQPVSIGESLETQT